MNKYIILLASGQSTRFNENKLLSYFKNKRIFEYAVELYESAANETPNTYLTVVSQYEEIRQYAQKKNIKVLESNESYKGISYSIKKGIESLFFNEDDFLIFAVADQPLLKKESVEKLLMCADCKTETARLFYGQRAGNPTLFSSRLVPELMCIKGDEGGSRVIKNHECKKVFVKNEYELFDVDTIEDLKILESLE